MNPWLLVSLIVTALIQIGAPIVLAVWLHRKLNVSWRWWWFGVLTMLVFQGITRVPAMLYLQSLPVVIEGMKNSTLFLIGFLLFAAVTAALFEEGGRWIAYRFFIPSQERTEKNGLMLGAGHGGIESMVIGVLTALSIVNYIVIMTFPASTFEKLGQAAAIEQTKQIFAAMPSWMPLLGAWERLSTIVIHLALSLLVLQSFRKGARFWWYALAAHTIVDFIPVIISQYSPALIGKNGTLALVELIMTIFAVIAWIFIKKWTKNSIVKVSA